MLYRLVTILLGNNAAKNPDKIKTALPIYTLRRLGFAGKLFHMTKTQPHDNLDAEQADFPRGHMHWWGTDSKGYPLHVWCKDLYHCPSICDCDMEADSKDHAKPGVKGRIMR